MALETLTANNESFEFRVSYSMIFALQITDATVALEYNLPQTDDWISVPGGSWSEDTVDLINTASMNTLFRLRTTAFGNNGAVSFTLGGTG